MMCAMGRQPAEGALTEETTPCGDPLEDSSAPS